MPRHPCTGGLATSLQVKPAASKLLLSVLVSFRFSRQVQPLSQNSAACGEHSTHLATSRRPPPAPKTKHESGTSRRVSTRRVSDPRVCGTWLVAPRAAPP